MSNPAVRPFNSIFVNKPNPSLAVGGANELRVGNGSASYPTLGAQSVAVGASVAATGIQNTIVGNYAMAVGQDNAVLGYNASTGIVDCSVAIGAGSSVSGDEGTAVGCGAISVAGGTALGRGAWASGADGIARGAGAVAAPGVFALGSAGHPITIPVAAGAATGAYLAITINGTVYKIALLANA